METRSSLTKPRLSSQQSAPTPQRQVFKVEDETDFEEMPEMTERPAPQKSSLPEGSVEMSAEDFRKIQAQKKQIKEKENELDERSKKALNALLGFGVSDKDVVLFFKGNKYIFKIRNLTSQEVKYQTELRNEMRKKIIAAGNDHEEISKLTIDFLFNLRVQTLNVCVISVTLDFKDGGDTLTFTIPEILNFLQVESLEELFTTWGDEALIPLWDCYSELSNEIQSELADTKKLNSDLKK